MYILTEENIISEIENSNIFSHFTRILNKPDNINLLNFIISKTNYLKDNVPLSRRFYHIKNKIDSIPICEFCGEEELEFNYKYNTYKNSCTKQSCKNAYQKSVRNQDEINEKTKQTKTELYGEDYAVVLYEKARQTNLNNWGVDHYTKTEEYKQHMINTWGYFSPFELKSTHDKTKQTLMDKHGVDHNMKIPEVILKRTETNIERWGFNVPTKNETIKEKVKNTNLRLFGFVSAMMNPEIQEKSSQTLFKNYGVYHPLQSKEIMDKMLNTMVERYGVKYWIQDDKNFEDSLKSNSSSYYEYILPNNEVIYLQGYEDIVLFELLTIYDIDDIVSKNSEITKFTGKIFYNMNEKEHRYYPDFYIISENKIVEVKSEYTFNADYDKNMLKQQACLDNNLNFEFRIFSKDEYKKIKKTITGGNEKN